VLAEVDDGLLGFAEIAASRLDAPAGELCGAELVRLYVQPAAQRRGIGRALLADAERVAAAASLPALWLTAWDGNLRARSFYARHGYADVGATTYTFQGRTYANRVLAKVLPGDEGADRDAVEPAAAAMPDAEFFRELERRRTQALVQRDLATLEALHAPDYQLLTPAGKAHTRESYLGLVRAEPFYAAWDVVGEMSVRVTADMAAIRYQARLAFPSGRVVLCWHTDLYERRPAGWQAVWSQATELAR
jgi:predicted N-acetyltransferase YhbS